MIRVRVPATSANLGPGFDVMGIALDSYNIFTFTESHDFSEDNLIYKSYRKVFEYLGKEARPVKITVEGDIPRSRGLGSSAACIVGGVMGANQILGNPLSKEEVLKLSNQIEGHPDNVAPAIYGGLIVSLMEGGKIHTGRIAIKNDLAFIALVPNFELSTADARAVLPEQVAYSHAIYNVGRASMLITGLVGGDNSLIRLGLSDKLHQPYRAKLIEGFDEIIAGIQDSGGLGSYLSGAGPTIMALADASDKKTIENIKDFMKKNHPNWQVNVHKLDKIGAVVI